MPSRAEILAGAKKLHRGGRFRDAERLYRLALEQDASDAETLFLHGAVCQALDMADAAIDSFLRAVQLKPDDLDARQHLGVVLAQQGRLDDAIDHFTAALRLQPESAEISRNLRYVRAARENRQGVALLEQGAPADAEACFRRALELVPDDADVLTNLGCVLKSQDRLDEAVASLQRATSLHPQHFEARFQLANALLAQGELLAAEDHFRQALLAHPKRADAHNNLGNALKMQGRFDEAIACYRRAVELDPSLALAYNNLGAALASQDKLDEALEGYASALRLKPDYLDARANRGTALVSQDRLDKALAEYGEVLKLDPDHRQAHFNLAFIHMEQNRPGEALASYDRILRLRPEDADAHYQRAMTLLAMGRFAEGWAEYEWRWRQGGKRERPVAAPRWTGTPLAGRTILLRSEQGQGDCLQFVRYAQVLKQQGATVVVECEPPLAGLLSRCRGVDVVALVGGRLPPCDVEVPLLSVPTLVGTTVESIPNDVPYLEADAGLVAEWKPSFDREPGLKIGIAWRGNPANPHDRQRSIPLESFAPIAAADRVHLYSLQVGLGSDEMAAVAGRWPVTDLAGRLRDFHDTAAAMRHLDLVITCDSAPAHLAGALGVPVWVALPFAPDWRWMLSADDCPWYPTMRTFRQFSRGDWHGVFERIARQLPLPA